MEKGKTIQIQKNKVEITENQFKVIKDKYLKDASSVEEWLYGVATNIALGEIIYTQGVKEDEIFKGVNYFKEITQPVKGNVSVVHLLHKGLKNYDARNKNMKKFMSNLYDLAANNQKCIRPVQETAQKFYNMMANFEFLPNSPTLMNAGRDLQQLSACYVIPIEDSIEGWLDAVHAAGIIHKSGGGTGFSISRVRPKGAQVQSTKGVASGPLSPLKMIDRMTQEIKQGGQRRGANMGILSVHHPDIMDFINIKKTPGELENFNISVAIDESFMNAVKNDTEYELIDPHINKVTGKMRARYVWEEMIKGAWETGDPGFVVIDRINNTDSNPTPALGQIESTNPCVAEGTLVNTPHGYKKVENLKIGDEISTVFGSETVDTIEAHENSPVFKVKFSDGGEQIVTAAHRYYAIKKGSESKQVKDYRLDELKVGDYIRIEPTPVAETAQEKYSFGLKKGILLGDGCYTENSFEKNFVKIAGNSDELEYNSNLKELFNNYNFRKDDLDNKSKSMNMLMSDGRAIIETMELTPAYSYEKTFNITKVTTSDEALGILDGLLSTDGNVLLKSNHPQIRFTTSSPELAQNIRRLLLMLGCHGRIFSSLHDDGGTINARKIERKHTRYDLVVSGSSAGIYANKSKLEKINPVKGKLLNKLRREWLTTGNTWKAAIKSIEPFGTVKVYDLYCSGSDTWITDGYVQRGCGEQPLLPNEPCNLGSINLSKFIKNDGSDFDWQKLKQCVWDCTHFLDNVITVNNYPLEEIEDISKKNRRIGLGVMGWAEALVLLGIPYNDERAFRKAEETMKLINDECLKSSIELGKERGVFFNFKESIYDKEGEYFRGQDVKPRNCARTTIAPTGTIGIAAGLQGAGIEPFFAIAYTRYNAKALDYLKEGKTPPAEHTFWEINPLFKSIAEKNNYFGISEDELWKKIEKNHKSVKGIKEIPEKVQNLFLTSHDLEPKDHIMIQAAFQKHTNNAVSKTINLRNEATIADVEECYMLSYKLGCKGITIYRDGSKQFQVLNLSDKKTEKKEEPAVIKPLMRKKSSIEMSTYYEIETGYGPLHVHINYDEEGPTRVFCNLAPIGTEVSGLTTALGILISKYLEYGGDPVKLLKHLNSIKGDKPFGFGNKRIDSIAHGIAQAVKDHLIKTGKMATKIAPLKDENKQLKLDVDGFEVKVSIYCPQCYSSNVEMQSGCSEPTCFDCGYSKCS